MTKEKLNELIKEHAYHIWQTNSRLGDPDDPVRNWLQAEKEVKRSLFILVKSPYSREDEA